MAFKSLFAAVAAALAVVSVQGTCNSLSMILMLILTSIPGAVTKRALCPDGKNSAVNAACCSLFAVRDDLQKNLFNGAQCNDMAHDAFRLTFHDAIAFSPALAAQGKFG